MVNSIDSLVYVDAGKHEFINFKPNVKESSFLRYSLGEIIEVDNVASSEELTECTDSEALADLNGWYCILVYSSGAWGMFLMNHPIYDQMYRCAPRVISPTYLR